MGILDRVFQRLLDFPRRIYLQREPEVVAVVLPLLDEVGRRDNDRPFSEVGDEGRSYDRFPQPHDIGDDHAIMFLDDIQSFLYGVHLILQILDFPVRKVFR